MTNLQKSSSDNQQRHGKKNSVNPQGSPVTMHWGLDIVSSIKETSGLDTNIERIDDLEHGIMAEYIEVLVSKKIK